MAVSRSMARKSARASQIDRRQKAIVCPTRYNEGMRVCLCLLVLAAITLPAATPPKSETVRGKLVVGSGEAPVLETAEHARIVLDGGKLKMIAYWCDVCYIRAYAPGPCVCCQKDTDLDLRELDDIR